MVISLKTLKERNNSLINRLLAEFEKVEGGTTSSTSFGLKNDLRKVDDASNNNSEISSGKSLIKFYSEFKPDLKKELKEDIRDFWFTFHKQIKSEFYNEAESFKISKNANGENILDVMVYKLILHYLLSVNASENRIESLFNKPKCQTLKDELFNYVQKFEKAEKMKKFLSQGDFKAVAKEIEDIKVFKSAKGKRFHFCVEVLDYLTEIISLISREIEEKINSEDKLRFLERIRSASSILDPKDHDINSKEMIELAKIIIKEPLDKKLLHNIPINRPNDTDILVQTRRIKQLYHKEATFYISDIIYEELQIPIGDPLINLFRAGCLGLPVLCKNEIFKENVLFSREQLGTKCREINCLVHLQEAMFKYQNKISSPLCDSDHEIPIELPFSEQHHSIVICQVLKTPCDKLNPPLVLECLHVISREAVKRLNTIKGVFDCPYCPNKSNINGVVEIFYE